MPQHKTPQGSTRAPANSRSKGPTKEQRQARQQATQSLTTHSAAAQDAADASPTSEPSGVVAIPPNLIDYQSLLDLLATAFHGEIYDQAFQSRLQHIKSLFFERKFLEIFSGEPALLPTYSARYIPYRTLAYLDLIRDVPVLHKSLAGHSSSDDPSVQKTVVVALGGGAGSELAVFGFHHLATPSSETATDLHIMTLDIGDFSPVLTRIHSALSSLPSPARPISTLSHSFHLCDMLSPAWPTPDQLASLQSATLITLMFTLNELFAQGSKTGGLGFITKLTKSMCAGSLLLLADSAGSFSDIVIGSRPYKITVLLDRLPGLKRVAGEDARWWRFDEKKVKYPVKLENMRYFWRVYQKV